MNSISRTERIRNTLKSNNFKMSKVCNYTGLSMDKYCKLIEDKEVNLTDNELWCLEFRLYDRDMRRLLY